MLKPFLNLNPAIDFFALVITGFCPVIKDKSSIALLITLESETASPTPILTTICPEDTVCPYDAVSLNVSAAGGMGAPYTYSWVDDSGFSVGLFDSISTIPTASSTWYYVTVEDNCETPPVTDSVRVLWYPLPDVDVTTIGNTGCYPITVEFTNTTTASLVQDCFWDFGNGEIDATGSNPIFYTYPETGVYDVSLNIVYNEVTEARSASLLDLDVNNASQIITDVRDLIVQSASKQELLDMGAEVFFKGVGQGFDRVVLVLWFLLPFCPSAVAGLLSKL